MNAMSILTDMLVTATPIIAYTALIIAILAGFHAEKIVRYHEEHRHKGRGSSDD